MNIHKIITAINKLCTRFLEHREFGVKVAIYQTLSSIAGHIKYKPFRDYIYSHKHSSIINYLEKKYKKEIETITTEIKQYKPHNKDNYCIWQCWWQGPEKMDELLRICTTSVKRNANCATINFITLDNYKDYIKFPDFIENKFINGKISLTELSDILRVNLLWVYGGLWIDATVLINAPIQDIGKYNFYTCPERPIDNQFVSDYKWSTSIMGGKANEPIFGFVSKMFENYWNKENKLIDYYLLDYLIVLGYKYVKDIKDDIDTVPYNNIQKHSLQKYLNNKFDEDIWREISSDTHIFKLSRKPKDPYVRYTPNKELTFYGYIYNEYINNI